MGEETQLGASIEDLTANLNTDDSDAEVREDFLLDENTSAPEDSISRWVNPREVGRWTDVSRVIDNQQVHIYTAVVNPSDVEAVKERLDEGNCDVREVYEGVRDGNRRIEFEEAHCPF